MSGKEVFPVKREDFDKLPALVVDFLNYFSVVKNKSQLTVEEYANDLSAFFKFIKVLRGFVPAKTPFEEIDITDIDINIIKSVSLNDAYMYLVYCKEERENSPATRSRKVSSLRSFYKYLTVQVKLLSENPIQELDTPKNKKALPKYMTLNESLKLLESIDGTFKERDYCIITLFLNCGLRLSELVSLNLSDIRSDNTMRVTGKGNKERTVYLNDACIAAINNYLAVRPVDGVKDKKALFISRQKNRISNKTVQYIVKTQLEKAGLDGRGLSTHKLRHTAATLMYQHGDVDVLVLKEILGHENLNTTEIYTHIIDKQLKEAAKANPLSGIKPPKKLKITKIHEDDDEEKD
ncbi:MAG: tyrosine recombinase XerC [Clostridiales bacterium]|nr:tyrosine recombinase XerC [Clostridiales bacterium]